MNKEKLMNLAKGGFMVISLIASVLNVVDISTTIIRKYRPNTVAGNSGTTTSAEDKV